MGSVNSVSFANIVEGPSANQEQISREDGKASKTLVEESKTQIEDIKETKEEEEEERGECGLCQYIKAGACKESWIEFEKCKDGPNDNEEESNVSKCNEFRLKFRTCMYNNFDYYGPLLAPEAKEIARMLSALQEGKEASLAREAADLQAEKEAILAGEAEAIAKALRIEEQSVLPAEAEAIAKTFRKLEAKKQKEKTDGSKVNQ